MKAKYYIFLLLPTFFFTGPAAAQQDSCNYSLSGKVIDEHDSSPLSYSYILHLESRQVATADYEGNFNLTGLCKGSNAFIISHIGCRSDTVSVLIEEKKQIQDFYLEHHAQELQAIYITEERQKIHEMDGNDLDRNRESLIGEMMDKIPGVASISTGSNFSVPVVHGMSGNRLSIINNGIPLLYQQWGSEHSPEIDPFSISSIELISGTEALKYSSGNISGALVASASQQPIDTGVAGKINLLAGSNKRMGAMAAQLQGRLKNLSAFSWKINASGKKAGNTKTPDYYLQNTAMEELNYSANLNYDFESSKLQVGYSSFYSEIGIFPGSHIEDYEELRKLAEQRQPAEEYLSGFSYKIAKPKQQVQHQNIWLKYEWDLNPTNKLQFILSRQENKREEMEDHKEHAHHSAGEEHEEENSSFHLRGYSASLDWKSISEKNHISEMGIQTNFSENEVEGEEKFIPGYSSKAYALYGLRKWYFEKIILDAGFRLSHRELGIHAADRPLLEKKNRRFSAFSVSSGLQFHLDKHQVVKPNLSYSQRSPKVNELFSEGVHHGTATLEAGNPEVKNEQVYELSINYNLRKKRLWLDVYAYNKYIVDFITLSSEGVDSTSHGLLHSYVWSQTNANFLGADLFFRYWLNKAFQVNMEASYLQATDQKHSDALAFIPANNAKSTFKYTFLHSTTFSNPFISVSGKYTAKQNDFPMNQPLGSPDGYFLLGAGAGFSTSIQSNTLSLDVSVQNILNKKYRDYMDRFRYFADAMGRNATLRVSYSF